MKTYNDFEKEVHNLSAPNDFSQNNQVLHNIPFEHYDLFMLILKRNADLINAVEIMNRIIEISIETPLTTKEAMRLSDQFRPINSLLNK